MEFLLIYIALLSLCVLPLLKNQLIISLAIVWMVSASPRNIIFPGFDMNFYPETVSHIIGVVSTAIFSFFAQKTHAFNER